MGERTEPAAAGATTEECPVQGRIPFRLRIGVTGHRNLPDSAELRKAVRDAIELAITESGAGPNTPLRLTVVSALAEGADRLVANEVLARKDLNPKLVCVLPVTRENLDVYRADFASDESRQEFDHLLEQAWHQIETPAAVMSADAKREDGYLWAGQEVVRNCDVLIAIWDGQPGHGKGGTADLILWTRKRDVERRRSESSPMIRRGRIRRFLAAALRSPAADETVFDMPGPLRIIVSKNPDQGLVIDDGPPWDTAAAEIRNRLRGDLARLDEFNRKSYDPAEWQRWADQLMNDLVPARYRKSPRLNGILEQITPHLNRADRAAIAAQKKFRLWSYAFFGCAALATIIAAVQSVVFPGLWWLTIFELMLLTASIIIIALETFWKNNNKHWFVYRFFAERLRSTCYLLAVGSTKEPETDFDVGGTAEEPTRNDWVRRAFVEILAECDVRQQEKIPDLEEKIPDLETLSSLIRIHWIGGQVNYFERTSKKLMRKHNEVRTLLYGIIGATIIAALLHCLRIWPLHADGTKALVMCAIGLPAVAAALSNVRSLREFSRHSFRFARMAAVMRRYLDKFDEESDRERLRQLAEEVGGLLTAETRDWLGVVSARALEP
jgi:hypothetical protein